jgi:hypothetical protein
MARRLALVEEDYLDRMKQYKGPTARPPASVTEHSSTARPTEEANNDGDDIRIYGIPNDPKEGLTTLVQLMPPRLRNKAGLLLHYLKDLSVDGQGRVKYESGETGSYLIDLVRFFASPKAMSPARPLDSNLFANVLIEHNVPQSALGAGRNLSHMVTLLDAPVEAPANKKKRSNSYKKVRWLRV